jgi:hypothetical protein
MNETADMTVENIQAEKFIESLVEELSVPEGRYRDAQKSYVSFGEWLHRDGSAVVDYDPSVYSQGSFRLGTVIKPINDADEYDIDSVCELKTLGKLQLSQQQLKLLLGAEVRSYHIAQNMVKPIREGRRCWTLRYADGAQFHMDIVPALPNGNDMRGLLEAKSLDTRWAQSAIAITDNVAPTYPIITADWSRSNPKGYADWFRSRMAISMQRRKRALMENLRQKGQIVASVEDLPDYKIRTPLQGSIMILKRHRDMMFVADPGNKPISVIITTLATHAYEEQETISEALFSILNGMDRFIQHDGQRYIISNPTDQLENFADKWEDYPERADAFFRWLAQAQEDFAIIAKANSLQKMNETVRYRMGTNLTDRAVARAMGASSTLKATTIASTAATPSFANEPRIPSKPKGFA